ncbi:unnamed protein product [Didymodactylos carnosus]|uniref:Uncharacterized protein n=1 Tax=Didymodactylos carnosus TaxID=1234261 RepID=A0A8S2IB17_9BILA|nr:unnamed protein product [Didymodactylos carnosus]CAF3722737.1 unnamed protein product [Didymodactylos carnosus]
MSAILNFYWLAYETNKINVLYEEKNILNRTVDSDFRDLRAGGGPVSNMYVKVDFVELPPLMHHSKMIKWLTMTFHELNRHFTRFWVHHRHIVSCIHLCSTAFITDGFQKPSIYICSNHNRGAVSEELGYIQLGCANRPAAKPRQRTNPKNVYGERSQGEPPTCQECRDIGVTSSRNDGEYIQDFICNVDRLPRMRNGSTTSYGVIFTALNCGIVVDFMPINLSEQVFVILHHWLTMLKTIDDIRRLPSIFIYDNACAMSSIMSFECGECTPAQIQRARQSYNRAVTLRQLSVQNTQSLNYWIKHDLSNADQTICMSDAEKQINGGTSIECHCYEFPDEELLKVTLKWESDQRSLIDFTETSANTNVTQTPYNNALIKISYPLVDLMYDETQLACTEELLIPAELMNSSVLDPQLSWSVSKRELSSSISSNTCEPCIKKIRQENATDPFAQIVDEMTRALAAPLISVTSNANDNSNDSDFESY